MPGPRAQFPGSSRKRRHPSTSRRNASYACMQCRKKRSRCRFETAEDDSCMRCKRAQIKCELEPDTDMRSHHYRTRNQQDQQVLHQFLDFLSGSDEPQSLIEMLKDRVPEAELVGRLDKLRMLISTQTTSQLEQNSNSSLTDPTSAASLSFTSDSSSPATPSSHAPSSSEKHLLESFQLIAKKKVGYMAPGAARSFGNLTMTNAIMANGYPSSIQRQQIQAVVGPLATCTPLNITSEMGGISNATASAMMGFRDAAREMIAQGVPVRTVLSMGGISLELFFRDRVPSDLHTLSNWACEFAKAWSFMPMLTCLAVIRYVSSLMRWLILPCRETYALMSPLLRPTVSQLMIPHTVDIDLCHFSVVRNYQLENERRWFDNLAVDSQRLHWLYEVETCIDEIIIAPTPSINPKDSVSSTKTKRLSPRLIECIDDVNSWSVHRAMLKDFPELESCVKLHGDINEIDHMTQEND